MLIAFPMLSILLTSCGPVNNWQDHIDDNTYVRTLKYHDNFNILQLTDIHWNANTSSIASKQYINKLLDQVEAKVGDKKIDLIEITGDQFMLANTYHIKTFVEFFEEQAEKRDFMYTVIWGNHDRHGLYNPNWLSKQFKNAKHCIYVEPEDNLYGRSNFVINLTIDGTVDTQAIWQIANLDSGASFSETAVSPFRDYDYIREDQVNWWKAEHDKVGALVPTIAYYHIPQQDNLEAWNKIHDEGAVMKNKFFKLEGFADNGNEEYASKFIEVGRENGLRAAFMGHAHNVDWTVDYNGVVLGLGVKTGGELYYAHIDPQDQTPELQEGLASLPTAIDEKFDLIGASLVTITDEADNIEGKFDLEHLYLNERKSGDFVKWVKY